MSSSAPKARVRAGDGRRAAGGYRGVSAAPRFPEQLQAMVTPAVNEAVRALAEQHKIPLSRLMRPIVETGLEAVRAAIAAGDLDPQTLP